MAAEYEEFKHSLRIQMIYDFHTEAAEIEIRLVEMLLTDEGTKESRAKAVQEHEMRMMALREQKEEERKRRCAEERERRRQDYLAQAALRSTQGRDVDPSSGRKGAPSKASDKSVPPKGLTVSQKENAPVQPLTASASGSGPKPEPPSILKKSPSAMTEAEASSNEAIFAEAAALLMQERLTADALVSPQPPQSRKRTNSTRLPNHHIPQITVNLVDPPPPTAPSAPAVLTAATKGKKAAKKRQVATPKPAAVSEESGKPDVDAEPPPSLSSWGVSILRGVRGNPPTLATEESDPDAGSNIISTFASSLTAPWDTTKKPNSGKKSKTVTFTDDVGGEDEAAFMAPLKGTRSSVNGKQAKKTVPALEEQTPRGPTKVTPQPPNVKKPSKASVTSTANKRAKAAAVSEELEGAEEEETLLSAPPPLSRQTSTTAAWGPVATGQTQVTTSQTGFQPPRGMEASRSKSARAETIPEPNVAWGMPRGGDSVNMPGALEDGGVSVESDEDDDWLDKENAEYWNKFIGLDAEKQAAETSSDPAKHVRWMPTVDHDSDEDDLGDDGDSLGGEMWMQYAIGGGEIPVLDAAIEPEVVLAQRRPELNVWEQGKTKKGGGPSTDAGKSSSTSEKTTLQGAPWPKIENWLSSTSRVGQSSGSAKFL